MFKSLRLARFCANALPQAQLSRWSIRSASCAVLVPLQEIAERRKVTRRVQCHQDIEIPRKVVLPLRDVTESGLPPIVS